ncbi:MAG: hypothetical protein D6712_02330, partial [Chloroflexi bacterium]
IIELNISRVAFNRDLSTTLYFLYVNDPDTYTPTLQNLFTTNGVQLGLYYSTENRWQPISPLPDDWPIFRGIAIDTQGTLWLGATGYRTADEQWHLLHPNPGLFLEHAGELLWSPPHLMLASSDNRLWYIKAFDSTPAWEGTAWYDPETGEGCMFTNLPGYIVEDDHQRLWMIVNNTLYQYDLNAE